MCGEHKFTQYIGAACGCIGSFHRVRYLDSLDVERNCQGQWRIITIWTNECTFFY